MMENQVLTIDSTAEDALSQILPHQSLLSSHQQGWNQITVEHHYQPAHETPEHYHDQHVLVIVTKGEQLRVERRLDGRFYQSHMTVGEAFLLPTQVHHQVWIGGEAEYIFIALKPEQVTHIAQDSVSANQFELIPQHQIQDSLIHSLGLALLSQLDFNQGCDRLYVEAAANFLTVHLLKHYSTQKLSTPSLKDELSHSKLRQVCEYITERLSDHLSLQDIASEIGMSQFHFSRLFKQSTGFTPWQYVSQRRFEVAKQLLAKPEFSIAEVSRRVGFINQKQLTTFFRKHAGMTPSAYRRSL